MRRRESDTNQPLAAAPRGALPVGPWQQQQQRRLAIPPPVPAPPHPVEEEEGDNDDEEPIVHPPGAMIRGTEP